jgi:hypothetical protein
VRQLRTNVAALMLGDLCCAFIFARTVRYLAAHKPAAVEAAEKTKRT